MLCSIRAFEQILLNELDKRFTNPFESSSEVIVHDESS